MRLVCVCPSPALDHTMFAARLADDEAVRASRSLTTAGGKGMNVARFAQGFGAKVTAVTLLGELGADHFSALARREGLKLVAVTAPGLAVRICPVLVSATGGRVLLVADRRLTVDAAVWSAFVDLTASASENADAVCVSGSFPRVRGVDAVQSLLNAVGSATPLWVDTSGRALASTQTVGRAALKINLQEASELLGWALLDETSARDRAVEAAEALGDGRDVVVTAGDAGAASSTAAGLRWRDAPVIEARNPTASGDAFMAAYLCAGRADLAAVEDPLLAGVLAGAVNAGSWTPAAPVSPVLALLSDARATSARVCRSPLR